MQPNKSFSVFARPFDARYKALRFYGAFFLYFMILLVGSIPNARAEAGEFASGVVLHVGAYSIITFLLVTGSSRRRGWALFQAFFLAVAMGALDEYVQSYFPYRQASVQDWLVDAIASLFTTFLLWGGSLFAARRASEM